MLGLCHGLGTPDEIVAETLSGDYDNDAPRAAVRALHGMGVQQDCNENPEQTSTISAQFAPLDKLVYEALWLLRRVSLYRRLVSPRCQ